MKLREFLDFCKISSTQVQDTLYLPDNVLLILINFSMTMVIMHKDWAWNIKDETMTVSSDIDVFTISKPCFKPYMVYLDGNLLEQNPLPCLDIYANNTGTSNTFYVNGRVIKTGKKGKELRIVYHYGISTFTPLDMDEELDIPDDFIVAVWLLTQWLIYVNSFEEGASLSNQFFNMYMTALKTLETMHGFNLNVKNFIAKKI